jgi:putative ABC transport system permease protein
LCNVGTQGGALLKNYLKIALRNLYKNKVFTLVNIIGLVIALTSCIFIALFILDELSYDRFHENTAHIYRVRQEMGMFGYSPTTSWLLAEKLVNEFPEIRAAVRTQPMDDPIYFQSGGQLFKENNNYMFADNSIFDIFTLPLKSGDAKKALTAPHSMVINYKMAKKYFGDQNPVGQVLRTNYCAQWYDIMVTGVLENIPANSDFYMDFIISVSVPFEMHKNSDRRAHEPHYMKTWDIVSAFTYVLLDPACNVGNLESKLGEQFKLNLPNSHIQKLLLEPLSDIHLYQIDDAGNRKPASMMYIYLFSAIGVLILLIAGINFVILSTASASMRAKEIGMRKVVGARRGDLIKQFMSESILLTFLALPLALLTVELFLPWVNTLLDKQLDANYFQMWQFVLILLGTTLAVGFCSGGYVAFYLSALQPKSILQSKQAVSTSRSGLRKTLIVTQLTVFIVLLVSSVVIYRQLRFVRETNLGFDKEHLIAINMWQVDFKKHFNAFKRNVSQNPNILTISAGSTLPMTETVTMFQTTTFPDNPEEKIQYQAGYVDYKFFKTLNARTVQGRMFSLEFSQDLSESVVLNQRAVQKFGLENPVGTLISLQDGAKRVIGVVDDFVVSAYYKTPPLVYYLKPGNEFIGTIILRIKPENISTTLHFLEDKWAELAPNAVFDFQFLDEELARQYAKDIRFGKTISVFTDLAILIASLGLFGLALFMIKQRIKELGVRKILGASIVSLFLLQSKEIICLVVIGNVIAWPIAWYVMNQWLQNFAYRIDLTIWPFLLSGLLALLIALLTISWQAIRAATTNPVEALRYE